MADDSYLEAEQSVVDWLVDQLDETKYAAAYAGALKENIYNAWSFRITGGTLSDTLCPHAVSTAGEIVGRYNERGDALEFASKVRSLFNTTNLSRKDVVGNVQQVQMMDDEASFDEATIQTNDRGKTITRPMTVVTIPLHVAFSL